MMLTKQYGHGRRYNGICTLKHLFFPIYYTVFPFSLIQSALRSWDQLKNYTAKHFLLNLKFAISYVKKFTTIQLGGFSS